jgi:anti-anti-sigma factor
MSGKHGGHWLEREDVGDVTVVRLKLARVDDDDAQTLFKQIYSLVDDMGRRNLVLSLATVEYLPSMALGKLVMLNRKTLLAKGRLALCHLTEGVTEIFDITHLADIFAIYPTEEEALRSFAG